MSKTLTLELPDEVYEAVERAAEATGKLPGEWIARELPQWIPARAAITPAHSIPPSIYEILKEIAPKMGKSIDQVAAEWLDRYGARPRPALSEEESRAAMERLLRHAGAQSLGHATGADNESIDADLAREYDLR